MPKNRRNRKSKLEAGIEEVIAYQYEVMQERGETLDADENSYIKIGQTRIPLHFDPDSGLLAGLIISFGSKKEILGYDGQWRQVHVDQHGYYDDSIGEYPLEVGDWTEDQFEN